VSESKIEQSLVKAVKRLGGECYKWSSPGQAGVCDRIVVLPNGQVHFIELKASNGRLSPLQKIHGKRLVDLHANYWVLWSETDVIFFIKTVDDTF
jgi:hypothetical protein